ncbi:MAG: hypothetical protein EPN73_15240 [Paraburkholderia sp.]|uniref:hypothetical protein n=1 Tax=Paraburkholderia sp. TaxID=1926495 RepID=UPI0012104958|nr:hypothetical protein [Paraburkholderia sp.]TAL95104.1 MAG: hypothetical protein EPN73_15240 [Paraburkholderia sp.]
MNLAFHDSDPLTNSYRRLRANRQVDGSGANSPHLRMATDRGSNIFFLAEAPPLLVVMALVAFVPGALIISPVIVFHRNCVVQA